MDHVCVVFPILPGKSDAARAFQAELDTARKADYARSERAIGISKELWFLASLPSGDHLVAYMESPDFHRALAQFSASREEFDRWFKRCFADVTGVDFEHLPPDMKLPELVSTYEA